IQKLLTIEQDAVISGPKTQWTAKKPLMLRRVFRFGISELHTQRSRQLATRQPTAKTQQRSQPCIRILPGFDRATLLMIERGKTVMLLLLDKEKAESSTNQRAETNQTFERPFQIRTGHHRVAHDLKNAGMEIPVGFQTDIRIIRGLSGQVP